MKQIPKREERNNVRKNKPQSMLLILLIAFSTFACMLIGRASAEPPVVVDDVVDIFVVWDEDFFAKYDPGNPLGNKLEFYKLEKRFKDDLDITLRFHTFWCPLWDSNDNEHCEVDLLVEATTELKWKHRGHIFNNEVMDILLVMTGQSMDLPGFSMSEEGAAKYDFDFWDACIVKYPENPLYMYGNIDELPVIQHEISHLFGISGHCGHWVPLCVMNKEAVYLFGAGSAYDDFSWVGSCKDTMLANKDRFTRYALFTVHFVISTDELESVIANSIKAELAKIGINVVIDFRTPEEIEDTVWGSYWDKTWDDAPGYGWDMAWYRFIGNPDNLDGFEDRYMADATPPNGGKNIMGWNNPKCDGLLEQAIEEEDPVTRRKLILLWQNKYVQDNPAPILFSFEDLPQTESIAFNLHHPVLSNRYVRQAIAHAINYPHIVDDIIPYACIQAVPIWPLMEWAYPTWVDEELYGIGQYRYKIAWAQSYLDMWYYSLAENTGTLNPTPPPPYNPDPDLVALGPVGDADFSGIVELGDFVIWAENSGTGPDDWPWSPGHDIDPDADNNGYVEMADFYRWRENVGKKYPFPGASPVTPLLPTEYPAIYIEPAAIEDTMYEPGTNFTVSVCTNYTGNDINAWQLTLYYNPLVLKGITVTNGDLIVGGSATFQEGTFNNTVGKLSLTTAYFFFMEKPAPLTSGPGILANVTFEVIGYGDSGILIGDQTRLVGFKGDGHGIEYDIVDASTMPSHIQNGYFRNVEPPPTHDIALATVTSSPIIVKAGELVNVTVVAENQGTVAERFDVKVYYDLFAPNWLIGDEIGIILDANLNMSLTFSWDTTEVEVGNHTIMVETNTIWGETDTDDNTYIDGLVSVYPVLNIDTGLGYATIQGAINAPQTLDGHTIQVAAGTYYEHVIVNKSLTLMGDDLSAIIDGNGTGNVVSVQANTSHIRQFTIQNGVYGVYLGSSDNNTVSSNMIANNTYGVGGGSSANSISGNLISSNSYGINLIYSDGNNVSGNTISDNAWYGICIRWSHNNTVSNNNMPNNYVDGIHTNYSNDNSISNNAISNATQFGMYLDSSDGNNVSNNKVSDSEYGIHLAVCDGNSVIGNTLSNNDYGTWLFLSKNNTFYHNNFIDIVWWEAQLEFNSVNNTWDNGYPSGGNYWSGYYGMDFYSGPYQNETGSDGIGDTTYEIDGNNRDNYPLIHPWGSIRNNDTGETYLTIQKAINAPETLGGHTIEVAAGTYYEHVIVNKSLTLMGEDSSAIIDGNGTGSVVTVLANNVTISQFTIRNGSPYGIMLSNSSYNTIIENTVSNNDNGIYLYYSDGNSVGANTVSNSSDYGYGITLYYSDGNTLDNNMVSSNFMAMQLSNSNGNTIMNNTVSDNDYSITLYGTESYDNNVSHNTVENNKYHGIRLNACNDNFVSNNTVSNNDYYGIHIHSHSQNNTVVNNTMSNNGLYGIYIYGSSNNSIYHNNFINNTIKQAQTDMSSENTWDDGYPSGGNYWSDHACTGNPSNGTQPYIINAINIDHYPFEDPNGWL